MTKDQLKIVFFGTPEFAVESLDALIKSGFNIAAVVTMPDKVAGRGNKISYSDVKKYALEHNLPLLQPANLKDEGFVEELRSIGAQLFIVIAFRMLPEVVWAMPPMGTFNLHASLLPRYRGAAPINRAVMNGDSVTGVTTFMLKHEIDTGDVLCQESIEIGPDENVGSVHDRLMHLGARLTVDTVGRLIDGTVTPIPQDEILKNGEATPAPKIFKEDCRIDWNADASRVHNHVRGLSPYPAAWTEFTLGGADGEPETTLKVLEVRKAEVDDKLSVGELKVINKKIYAGCGEDGVVELLSVQPAGKKAMPATDWVRGLRLEENKRKPWLR